MNTVTNGLCGTHHPDSPHQLMNQPPLTPTSPTPSIPANVHSFPISLQTLKQIRRIRVQHIAFAELDAILLVEDKKENLINSLASSWIYEKLVTTVRLSDYITDTKIEYSHLYSTSSLLPHWDTITATGPTRIASPLCSQQQARTSTSSSSSSNMLVIGLVFLQSFQALCRCPLVSSTPRQGRFNFTAR